MIFVPSAAVGGDEQEYFCRETITPWNAIPQSSGIRNSKRARAVHLRRIGGVTIPRYHSALWGLSDYSLPLPLLAAP